MARIKPQALLQQSKKKKAPRSISVTTIGLYSVPTVVMLFFLFATYRHWSQRKRILLLTPWNQFEEIQGNILAELRPGATTLRPSPPRVKVTTFNSNDLKASPVSAVRAWAMNVIRSVGIIMANKQLMSANGYSFTFAIAGLDPLLLYVGVDLPDLVSLQPWPVRIPYYRTHAISVRLLIVE